jgi:hypothetical protein
MWRSERLPGRRGAGAADRGVEAGYGGELRGVFPWLLNSSCTSCSSFASCDVNRKKPRYRSHRLRGVRRRKSTVHLLPRVAGECERLSERDEGELVERVFLGVSNNWHQELGLRKKAASGAPAGPAKPRARHGAREARRGCCTCASQRCAIGEAVSRSALAARRCEVADRVSACAWSLMVHARQRIVRRSCGAC